ncbi:MAG: riboflavin synthase [Candidatus Fermentibacteraceae bacterium]|nr:riboflavin synthase [Candidatus Fermentibacteraceae bacterium]
MFTGLIEAMGTVRSTGAGFQVESDTDLSLVRGDSLAVNGSCLTVTGVKKNILSFDVSPETFRRIVVPVPGARVNLERSMPADGRFHGHIVTGHIDEAGIVTKKKKTSGFSEFSISFQQRSSLLLVEKGSVAVAGISFTVVSVTRRAFVVAVIPETLKTTTAGEWKPGYRVNLEFDIIGKYVTQAAQAARSSKSLREYLEQSRRS